MTRYRKRPVVIDAICNSGAWVPVIEWLDAIGYRLQMFDIPPITREEDGTLRVRTLEGTMRCMVGDWLIRGIAGEFYPCKPDIFEATYERA